MALSKSSPCRCARRGAAAAGAYYYGAPGCAQVVNAYGQIVYRCPLATCVELIGTAALGWREPKSRAAFRSDGIKSRLYTFARSQFLDATRYPLARIML